MTFARLVGVCALAAGVAAAVTTAALAHPAKANHPAKVRTALVEHFTVLVKSDEEHAKKSPAGKWADAFLPANLSVKAGAEVVVTFLNYDDSAHTFNISGLKLNQLVLGGSATKPHKTVFTFTAPTKTGKYLWHCDTGCDPWAMAHVGYMRGYVTVTA